MSNPRTQILAALTALLVVAIGVWFLLPKPTQMPKTVTIQQPQAKEEVSLVNEQTIGSSVEGRDIVATSFGSGDTHLLFAGGMHGGYEWNSSLLAYQFIDYLKKNPNIVPDNLTIDIIPAINPDGLFKVIQKEGAFTLTDVPNPDTRIAEGRFNAHGVDLNRNFDCNWAPKSTWKGKIVSAGTSTFSEPEAVALRDFVFNTKPNAVIFWHSKANNVYASECNDGILPDTLTLMKTYADAAGYGKVESFDAYPITGDSEGWLASINIPAVTVELKSANSSEWSKNVKGIVAVINYFQNKTLTK